MLETFLNEDDFSNDEEKELLLKRLKNKVTAEERKRVEHLIDTDPFFCLTAKEALSKAAQIKTILHELEWPDSVTDWPYG